MADESQLHGDGACPDCEVLTFDDGDQIALPCVPCGGVFPHISNPAAYPMRYPHFNRHANHLRLQVSYQPSAFEFNDAAAYPIPDLQVGHRQLANSPQPHYSPGALPINNVFAEADNRNAKLAQKAPKLRYVYNHYTFEKPTANIRANRATEQNRIAELPREESLTPHHHNASQDHEEGPEEGHPSAPTAKAKPPKGLGVKGQRSKKLQEEGRCIWCGEINPEPHKMGCPKCLAKRRDFTAQSRARKRLQAKGLAPRVDLWRVKRRGRAAKEA